MQTYSSDLLQFVLTTSITVVYLIIQCCFFQLQMYTVYIEKNMKTETYTKCTCEAQL